jgi:hypothetical protein
MYYESKSTSNHQKPPNHQKISSEKWHREKTVCSELLDPEIVKTNGSKIFYQFKGKIYHIIQGL